MPRDFVPVLYHEWETYDAGSQAWHRRYEVTEAFAMVDRETGESFLTLTSDSHAMHIGHTQTAVASLTHPPMSAAQVQQARAHLFATFYAAMAALE